MMNRVDAEHVANIFLKYDAAKLFYLLIIIKRSAAFILL